MTAGKALDYLWYFWMVLLAMTYFGLPTALQIPPSGYRIITGALVVLLFVQFWLMVNDVWPKPARRS